MVDKPQTTENHEVALYFSRIEACDLSSALELILPMAKGYAVSHDVGNNKIFIKKAEDVLEKFYEKHPEYLESPLEETNESENELVDDGGQFGMGA